MYKSLWEQCSVIVKLTASKDGQQMSNGDLSRVNKKLNDVLLLPSSDHNSGDEDQVHFEGTCEKYLECCAGVKTTMSDSTQ